MNNEKDIKPISETEATETTDRREALKKLGKYSAYVAPFTVLALSAKGATASGPGPHHK
jgi:hypothetical protein